MSGRLHPHQVELCAALQLCGELEEEGRQRELAGAQASLHLHRREATLEGLLVLNHQLIAALHQYKTLLEGMTSSFPLHLILCDVIDKHFRTCFGFTHNQCKIVNIFTCICSPYCFFAMF